MRILKAMALVVCAIFLAIGGAGVARAAPFYLNYVDSGTAYASACNAKVPVLIVCASDAQMKGSVRNALEQGGWQWSQLSNMEIGFYAVTTDSDPDPQVRRNTVPYFVLLNHDKSGNLVLLDSFSNASPEPADVWRLLRDNVYHVDDPGYERMTVPVLTSSDQLYDWLHDGNQWAAVLHFQQGSLLSEMQRLQFEKMYAIQARQSRQVRIHFAAYDNGQAGQEPYVEVYSQDNLVKAVARLNGFPNIDELERFLDGAFPPIQKQQN